jgi:hypothetical protein
MARSSLALKVGQGLFSYDYFIGYHLTEQGKSKKREAFKGASRSR